MDLSKYLPHIMESHEIFEISFFGYKIPIYDSILVMWIITAFFLAASLALTRNFKTVPEGRQNFAEIVVDLINSFTKSVLGHHWRLFAPYLGTVLIFLILSNIVSIFSIVPTGEQLYKLTGIGLFEHLTEFEIRPPTKDITVTVTMAILSMLVVIIGGIRVRGLGGFLKSFVEPVPVMLPFKLLDFFIRPTSLSLRLFGNILGTFIVMELIYLAMPLALPAFLSIYLDLFDGALQAYVFVFLTSMYIAEAIE